MLNSSIGNRLADSVETALNLSNGLLNVEYENESLPKKFRKIESITFSSNFRALKVVLQLKKLSQDYFPLTRPMVLVRNVRV